MLRAAPVAYGVAPQPAFPVAPFPFGIPAAGPIPVRGPVVLPAPAPFGAPFVAPPAPVLPFGAPIIGAPPALPAPIQFAPVPQPAPVVPAAYPFVPPPPVFAGAVSAVPAVPGPIFASSDIAPLVDAADGVMDGHYFGSQIVSVPPPQQAPLPEPEPEPQPEPAQISSPPPIPVRPAESRVVYQSTLPPRPDPNLEPDVFEHEFVENCPVLEAPTVFASTGLGEWTNRLPWRQMPEDLQRKFEEEQWESRQAYEKAKEAKRTYEAEQQKRKLHEYEHAIEKQAAERVAYVEKTAELKKTMEERRAAQQIPKKVVEVPIYRDVYVTEEVAAPAAHTTTTTTAVSTQQTTGYGIGEVQGARRLGLMMGGPLKGQLVPVDADGRPVGGPVDPTGVVQTQTTTVTTQSHGAAPPTPYVPAPPAAPAPYGAYGAPPAPYGAYGAAPAPYGAGNGGQRLGLMMGGPLKGQVMPVDANGRPVGGPMR